MKNTTENTKTTETDKVGERIPEGALPIPMSDSGFGEEMAREMGIDLHAPKIAAPAEIARLTAERDALAAKLDDRNTRVTELERERDAANERLGAALSEKNALAAKLENAERERNDARRPLSAIAAEARAEQAERERDAARSALAKMTDLRNSAAKERDDARGTLTAIAAAMQCEPDDDSDLVEAVRLLVEERDEARALTPDEWRQAAQEVVNLFDPMRAIACPTVLVLIAKAAKAANTSLRARPNLTPDEWRVVVRALRSFRSDYETSEPDEDIQTASAIIDKLAKEGA